MSNSSIWPIDSNSNEEVLCIPQSSCITGASQSDCLVSCPGHLLGVSYNSAEMQLVYSTAPADWAMICLHIVIWHQVFLFSTKDFQSPTWPIDGILTGTTRLEWTRKKFQWRGIQHYPKLKNYSLTISKPAWVSASLIGCPFYMA